MASSDPLAQTTPTKDDEKRRKKALAVGVASFGASLLLVGFAGPRLVKKMRSSMPEASVAAEAASKQSGGANLAKMPGRVSMMPMPFSQQQKRQIEFETNRTIEMNNKKLYSGEDVPVDDNFNAGMYAAKALGIATLITFTTFGTGIYLTAKKLGADSPQAFADRLRDALISFNRETLQPKLPTWLQQKSFELTKEDEEMEASILSWIENDGRTQKVDNNSAQ